MHNVWVRSIIDRLTRKGKNAPPLQSLNLQYRMSKQIGDLISRMLYGGQVLHSKPGDKKKHIFFYQSNGLAETVENSNSMINKGEAEDIVKLYDDLMERRTEGVEETDLVVLTFYEAQWFQISQLKPSMQVFTIDRFQGQEATTVIISTIVRGNVSNFVGDMGQINVALSRAKEKLCIVGDRPTLQNHELWREIF